MKRSRIFARRCLKETLRDPLSYVFCVGFPVVMLIIFRLIAHYTNGNAFWFELPYLTPGIIVFSYTFVMLYTAILVAKDKSSSFLGRLFASPMRAGEFLLGYALPSIAIGLLQNVACFATATILGILDQSFFALIDMLKVTIALFPILCFFISVGILFGTCFSEKAAPGIASVVISVAGFLSGAWMPLEEMGGLCTFATCLPFYPAVRLGRAFTASPSVTFGQDLAVVCAYALVIGVLSILAFHRMMKKDNR